MPICAVVAFLFLAGAGVAAADAPFRLADRVTDRAGVLDPAGKARVQQAVDQLRAEKGYDLFVVYVRSFDGAQTDAWADRTAQLSQLGRTDVLLAVATQDRAYHVSYAQSFPLSQQTTDAIADKDVEPRLAADDWAGAAVGLADALRAGGASSSGGGGVGVGGLVVAGVAVVGVGGYLLVRRRRRGAATEADRPAAPAPESGEFADVTTDDLNYRGSQALLDVDDAVRRSEQELSAARAHFGDAAVAEFAAALDAARGEMLRGFTLRQQLDDDIPEDEPTKRRMLAEIITVCRSADERLDAQVAAFDKLRNLEATAPDYLAGLATRLDATNARLPEAEAAWAQLQKQYAPGSWEPAAGNLDQARRLLTGAAAELAAARDDLAAAPPRHRRRRAGSAPLPGGRRRVRGGCRARGRADQAAPLSPRPARVGPVGRPALPGRDRRHRPPPRRRWSRRRAPRLRGRGRRCGCWRDGARAAQRRVRAMVAPADRRGAGGAGEARRSSRGGRPRRRSPRPRRCSTASAAWAPTWPPRANASPPPAPRPSRTSPRPARCSPRATRAASWPGSSPAPRPRWRRRPPPRTRRPPDPMAALRLIDEADAALDRGLVTARDAQAAARRAAAARDQALLTARPAVAAAEDFIGSRRGAVGTEARTRLAEAQRHLAQAQAAGRQPRRRARRGPGRRHAGPAGPRPGPVGRVALVRRAGRRRGRAARAGSRASWAASCSAASWRAASPAAGGGGGYGGGYGRAVASGAASAGGSSGGFGGSGGCGRAAGAAAASDLAATPPPRSPVGCKSGQIWPLCAPNRRSCRGQLRRGCRSPGTTSRPRRGRRARRSRGG